MKIIPASEIHHDDIWEIFRDVIASGDTHTFAPETSREDALAYWTAKGTSTYVALSEDHVAATYILKPNQVGLGSHVANASYMVAPSFRGRGIGSAICDHSIDQAKTMGFLAIQFNIVVSTNHAAVALWKKHGFQVVGTLPKVFHHRKLGYVDAFVMHRFL